MTPASPIRIREGTTEVWVSPAKQSPKGPAIRRREPFYNPAMEMNRDVSILVTQWFLNQRKTHVHLLDGLAASGIRGIRYAHELEGDFDVTLNDRDDASVSLMKQNIQHLSAPNITVVKKDLAALLSEHRFDSIDIDPFGSPIYFFDAAVRSISHKGIIACTATDTAPLCGVFPKVCYRRYSAWPLHGPTMHETGLRILLGALCRIAATYDHGIEPLLCYTTDHYFRIYVQLINSKSAANASMAQFSTLPAKEIPLSQEKSSVVGPFWLGSLQKKEVLQELHTLVSTKQLRTRPALWKLLVLLEEEADAPRFFYTTNDLSSLLKQSPPPLSRLFERLHQQGFLATRTHFSPTGFKTDAPFAVIKEVFK